MMKNNVMTINELYQDRSLYSSQNMFSPPSERLSHVIRFELTKGCSWAKCTYCGGYDGIKHGIKSLDEYKEHVEKVWERIGERSNLARSLTRIFIGGGNALEVDTEMLDKALQYTAKKFVENTGMHAQRISIYGRTGDILQQGKKGLTKLKYGRIGLDGFFNESLPDGLDLIYWGVESGSSDVLEYVNKGCTKKEILKAARIIRKVPIEISAMIMPGLGGEKFYHRHIKESAKVLGTIRPRFLTFMGVNPSPKSRYSRNMIREQEAGTNRKLTNKELANQMIEIIRKMPTFETKVGCFDCNVDTVGFNPLNFGAFDIYEKEDKDFLVNRLKERAKRIE